MSASGEKASPAFSSSSEKPRSSSASARAAGSPCSSAKKSDCSISSTEGLAAAGCSGSPPGSAKKLSSRLSMSSRPRSSVISSRPRASTKLGSSTSLSAISGSLAAGRVSALASAPISGRASAPSSSVTGSAKRLSRVPSRSKFSGGNSASRSNCPRSAVGPTGGGSSSPAGSRSSDRGSYSAGAAADPATGSVKKLSRLASRSSPAGVVSSPRSMWSAGSSASARAAVGPVSAEKSRSRTVSAGESSLSPSVFAKNTSSCSARSSSAGRSRSGDVRSLSSAPDRAGASPRRSCRLASM